jgi:uncharacterized protein YcbX
MRVSGLWRYPVKSMIGERRAGLDLDERGADGDRRFGVLDLGSGTIVSAKRDARLLEARAMLAGVTLTIRLPTGETLLGTGPTVDRALSSWLGRPVRLVEVRPTGRATFEMPSDYEDDGSPPVLLTGPAGSFADVGPLHLLTTASVRAVTAERPDLQWDLARFRPNILLDADGGSPIEQGWMGRHLVIGEVELEVQAPCDRCVMTTRPQPGGIDRQLEILRHIDARHGSNLGVLASVVRSGRVDVGQAVS